MIWILRFLALVFLFYFLRSLLSRVLGGRAPRAHTSPIRRQPGDLKRVGDSAVKDPQCGTYVDRSLAVVEESGAERLYFCSEECRRRYLEEAKAASIGKR